MCIGGRRTLSSPDQLPRQPLGPSLPRPTSNTLDCHAQAFNPLCATALSSAFLNKGQPQESGSCGNRCRKLSWGHPEGSRCGSLTPQENPPSRGDMEKARREGRGISGQEPPPAPTEQQGAPGVSGDFYLLSNLASELLVGPFKRQVQQWKRKYCVFLYESTGRSDYKGSSISGGHQL